MQRKHVFKIAAPVDPLAAISRDNQSGDRVDRTARRVFARNPFRIVERHRARAHWDALMNTKDSLSRVGEVDIESQFARKRTIGSRGSQRHRAA